MTKLGEWIAAVRREYIAKIRASGDKAAWHYFDFDESGNLMIPRCRDSLIRFYNEILTPKDKGTFMLLVAPLHELEHDKEDVYWDYRPHCQHLPGCVTMKDWLRQQDINLE